MSPKSARLIRRVCAGWLLLGIVALAEPCAAQYRWPSTPYRGPRTPLSNAAHNAFKSNLDSAKNFLDAANKRLADIRPKHQQTEAEFKKEQREYQQARDAAKRQFEEAPELVRAREKHTEAKKAYDEQHQRIVAALKSQAPYKTAVKRLAEIKALHHSPAGKELSDEARKAHAKDEAAALAEVRRLEDEAVNKDPSAKQAHEREHAAADELAKHTKKREATIDGDPRVSSSKSAFEKARDTEQLAHREFLAAQADAAQAQRNYNSATAAFAAHEAQEAQQRRMNSVRNWRGYRNSRTLRRY
jgi:chromosome segregation ATPase